MSLRLDFDHAAGRLSIKSRVSDSFAFLAKLDADAPRSCMTEHY